MVIDDELTSISFSLLVFACFEASSFDSEVFIIGDVDDDGCCGVAEKGYEEDEDGM